jgi:hypothetical protein
MVICKFQRFGIPTCQSPLELSWEKSKSEYRASIIVIKVVECNDRSNQKCFRSTGQVLHSLSNVHSSCIFPISPTLESEENRSLVLL